MIWKLEIPKDSIDGQPLVTTISEIVIWYFPYPRLSSYSTPSTSTNNNIVTTISSWFLRPEVVICTLLFYVFISKPLMKRLRQILHFDRDPIPYWFQCCIIIHNAILAMFSFICAYNTFWIIVDHIRTYGVYDTYCDPNSTFWNESTFGAWAFIFYLSKYYEFVDTWILVLKGKDASFLQVYHHTGIVFIMWCAVLSQSAWLLFVVLLNSTIHTLMYTYFCIKSISPKTEISIAKYLTMAQIGQFFTGILCTIPIFIYGETCDTQSSRFALACLHTYGFGLIALFISFAKRKYKKDV
jgi:GNS1/SUR4 family